MKNHFHNFLNNHLKINHHNPFHYNHSHLPYVKLVLSIHSSPLRIILQHSNASMVTTGLSRYVPYPIVGTRIDFGEVVNSEYLLCDYTGFVNKHLKNNYDDLSDLKGLIGFNDRNN